MPTAEQPLEGGDAVLHEALIRRASDLAATPEAREEVVLDLIALAGERWEPLERALDEYQRRLADPSNDLGTRDGLRLLAGALDKVSASPTGLPARRRPRRQRRDRRGRRRGAGLRDSESWAA